MPLGVSLHRPLPRGLAVLFGSLALLLATGAGTASATPGWLPSVALSASGKSAERPQVAIDATGDAVAVWSRYNGSETIVQSATRPAGGSWSSPVDISVAGGSAETPQVAISRGGEALAVWTRSNGSHYIIQAARRPPGGAWSAPVDLSAIGQGAFDPQVALSPTGDAVAIWVRYDGSHYIAQAANRPAGGAWSEPVDLSAAGQDSETAQVAIDPGGSAVATWVRFNGSNNIVQTSSRGAGGTWSTTFDLSATGQDAHNPQVVLDPSGRAVAVWERYDGTSYVIQAANRTAAGDWSAVADLSAIGKNADSPQVAVDDTGNAVAIWSRFNGSDVIIQSASRPAGGTWGPPVDLSEPGQDAMSPQVDVDPAGDAVALWTRSNGGQFVIQGASRPAGGAWGAPTNVATDGQETLNPAISVDAAGNAVAIWVGYNGSHFIAQAAGYDGAGPQLRDLRVPAAAAARQQLSFSVSPLDVWSALGATTWSFGDGTAAAGTAVSHSFGKPGTYTVSVTSADALGNASSASGTVKIIATKAKAAKQALVKNGKALVKLRCPGQVACTGKLKISVKAKPAPKKKPKRLQIGAKRFKLKAGKSATVRVKLTGKGLALLKAAGKGGLRAKLGGGGVKAGPLTLKPALKRR